MKNFNTEMIEKAKAAKSAEELIALAKDNGVEMTADEAATYFAQLNPKSGELDDDELDAVAGGAYSVEEWNAMSTEEREAAQMRSVIAILIKAPCELD